MSKSYPQSKDYTKIDILCGNGESPDSHKAPDWNWAAFSDFLILDNHMMTRWMEEPTYRVTRGSPKKSLTLDT